jgi:hypothetical protein
MTTREHRQAELEAQLRDNPAAFFGHYSATVGRTKGLGPRRAVPSIARMIEMIIEAEERHQLVRPNDNGDQERPSASVPADEVPS